MSYSARVQRVLSLAEDLAEPERAELVDAIARTLPGYDDVDLDDEELDRRMESVRNGTAQLIPYEEARKVLFDDK